MASEFFIDPKLKKTIEKDIKKRDEIEKKIHKLQEDLQKVNSKIEDDLENFYIQSDDKNTVLSTLKYYEVRAKNEKKKNLAKEIEDRYINNNLIIEDTLNLLDWYELMCKDYNNKI